MPITRLKLVLQVTAVALALLTIACFVFTPAPKEVRVPRLGNTFDDLTKPHHVYTFCGVSVWIAKVDVLSLDPSLNLSGITFSTKENLAPPFRNTSIDGLIWNRLCECKVEDGCKTAYGNDRHALWQMRQASLTPDKPWAVAMPKEWQKKATTTLGWPTAYFTAGIAAQQEGATHTSPEKVTLGVTEVCRLTHSDGVTNLGVPLLGAGAAIAGAKDKKMDLEMAVRAVLDGVNKSASNEECPARITLLLYPGVNSARGIKNGVPANDGADEAKWLKTGNALHAAITDGDSVMRAPTPWSVRRALIVSWQVSSVVFCVLVSAIIACHLGVPLTPTSVVQPVVAFLLVALGVQLGTTAIAIKPVAPSAYCLLLVAALVVPVWSWKKLGEIPETKPEEPAVKPDDTDKKDTED